ncbi:cytochrome c maturation protein CcmE [Caulobacter sp. 17J80-11]|uniref:cytochrome c maturation protein CcmE n=1 Tax=Caulobacter sp. 17J80-11 TaxID=2763502 RepID=UPI001653E711|nr:cytochrome c maturation protein CcmE [Caulobacter sp. 17J80-11]MBC6983763.1 cytochrome c maturation protein CcmE [Caulobacter sp. 17J80-11]
MALLPKSRTARRRLAVVAVIAPVLAGAVGLALYAMQDAVIFFYGPTQAQQEAVPPGRTIRIGGLVEPGSVRKSADGVVRFQVTDGAVAAPVVYHGQLPDLFREGQGVVVQGAYDRTRTFKADEVLAKHDETYMPREVADALKANGEWRG